MSFALNPVEMSPDELAWITACNSAADFYGHRESIISAVAEVDEDFAHQLQQITGVYDFFLKKPQIIGILSK